MHSENNLKRFVLFVLAVIVLFPQCKKEATYSDNTFFGQKVMILGHRGMGELYKMPGNTYEAIAPVIAIGADGAEIDIQMTRDTVLVLFHDHFMNSRTTCSGRVYEKDWAEIKQCRYYAIGNMIYVNSVDELFSRLPDLNKLYFSFDCSKVDDDVEDVELYRNQYLRAIKRLCEKYDMSDNVLIEGDEALLKKAQQIGLSNKLFLFNILNENSINVAKMNGFFGISTSLDWLNNMVDMAHQNGLYVMVWSPDNDAQNKEALKQKVDIIQTDDPMTLLKLLKRFNYEYVIQ